MDWIKCKETTGKIEPSLQLLAEERFTFQKSISTVVYDHDIPSQIQDKYKINNTVIKTNSRYIWC